MRVAIIYNKDLSGVINQFGMQNKEFYSPQTIHHIAESLEQAGHNVHILDGNKTIIEQIEHFMPRVMEGEQMGMVFNMAYGIQGESRYTHIPSMLEMLGIPYIGSSPSGHAIALDKILTKIIWKNNGLPTPEHWVFNSPKDDISHVKYPVIVKPKMESVSFGLKVVHNESDLREAIHFVITEFQQQALVEQFVPGREFCVGMIGNTPVEVFPVLEVDLEGDPNAIQTMDDKQGKPRRKVCPAEIDLELAAQMQTLSQEAFKALNLRDFARVDIRLDESDNIHLLEINSMASLGATGSYLTAANVAGYDFGTLVNKMLDVAAVRYFADTMEVTEEEKPKQARVPLHSRLRTYLRSRQSHTEKFLKTLVNANTHVRNVENVNRCTQLIQTELSQLGFTHELYPQLEVGNLTYFTNSFDTKLDVLLLLSLDNRIQIGEHQYYQESERYLSGTGIWENKGGIAVGLAALQTLRFARCIKKIKIGIVLATDNSLNGKFSQNLIRQKAETARYVIGMHGSARDGGVVTSRSGSASYQYAVKLRDNTKPENVAQAASVFNKTLAGICELSQKNPSVVISPYDIGFKSNIFKTSAFGTAGISVRFNTIDHFNEVDQKIRKLSNLPARMKKLTEVHLEGGMSRPPMVESENNNEFFKKIQKIARGLDIRVKPEHRWSSSDICSVQNGTPRIDGMGPRGEFSDSQQERIIRNSLIDTSLVLAMLLRSL